ncbi:MAG: glycosyltransferase family 2 protein [Bdellovibrionales bacterium]
MILRTCVVIPVYNENGEISAVVKEIVLSTAFPVLVVDNGSETLVDNALYAFEVREAMAAGRVRVVRFDRHLGKGAALRYAIHDLVSRGFTHMLTIEGDGRIPVRGIFKAMEIARAYPWDLIIGKCRSLWTGLRIYPLLPLQTVNFFTRNEVFETEVLLRLLWKGIRITDFPLTEGSEGAVPDNPVSHILRLWDYVRTSALGAALKRPGQGFSGRRGRGRILLRGVSEECQLGDRDRIELVPLLGKLVAVDVTAFHLAGSMPGLHHFAFRVEESDRSYEVHLSSPSICMFRPTVARELQVYTWAVTFMQSVEEMVRKHPDQKFILEPLWSTLPVSPAPPPGEPGDHCLHEDLWSALQLKPLS